jgi:hypothetical protein
MNETLLINLNSLIKIFSFAFSQKKIFKGRTQLFSEANVARSIGEICLFLNHKTIETFSLSARLFPLRTPARNMQVV